MEKARMVWHGACAVAARRDPDDGTTEAILLRAGRAGDREALGQLLALHDRSLLALCRGIVGHAEEAEDAVQETFLRALRSLPGYRAESSFRTWLFRIAVNVCLKRRIAARRQHLPPPDDALPFLRSPGATTSPETVALSQLQLQEALRQLMPRQRAVLLLKEREGWSVAEIASRLHWSERQVRHELAKARRTLAAWRQEATHSFGAEA